MFDAMHAAQWIALAQVVATSCLAAVVAGIAYQQFRLARQKLRLDLYYRRFKILTAVTDAIGRTITGLRGPLFHRMMQKLARTLREARFLFDEPTFAELTRIDRLIWRYHHCQRNMSRNGYYGSDGRAANDAESDKLECILFELLTDLPLQLRQFLAIDDKLSFSREPDQARRPRPRQPPKPFA